MKKKDPARACRESENEKGANGALPESGWVRIPKSGLRGLSRSFIFALAYAGKIRSSKIIGGGHGERGARLVFLPSLDALIEASEVSAEGSGK